MNTNNTLSEIDVLDILFANRNKSYGAYQLRKNYDKRLAIAIAIMLSLCLLFSVLYKFYAARQQAITQIEWVSDPIVLQNVSVKEKPVIQLPTLQHFHSAPAHIATIQITTPKIVSDKLVLLPPASQDKMTTVKIDVTTTGGATDGVTEPPVNAGTGAVEKPAKDEPFAGEVFTVQQEARFPGGMLAWTKFLQRNLRSDVPTENGAVTGSYTVVVSFLVDRQGVISEVKAENDPGYGTAAEAVRVIQRGPVWIPALQNGHNVIYRQKQAITFVVAEQE